MYEYDSSGRMKYNPEIHFNHGQPWADEDLVYLCKFYRWGERIDMSFTLGRTEATIAAKIYDLRKQDRFEKYRLMYDKLGGLTK